MFRLTKSGIFATTKRENEKTISFIDFSNIYEISLRFVDEKWEIFVRYRKSFDKTFGYKFLLKCNIEAENKYGQITEAWINFNESSRDDKIDRLLAQIEVLPGGEEYQRGKERFEQNL